jgi:hypothetical protein
MVHHFLSHFSAFLIPLLDAKMLPPSNPFLHHKLKLAEALSNVQAIEVPPPPNYSGRTGMPVTLDSVYAHSTTAKDDNEDNEEEYLAPTTIHVDASIRIDGQSNTLILAPPNAMNKNSTSASAVPCADQSPNIPASAWTASTGYGCAHGQTSTERLTSTILTTLRDTCGAVGLRSWEININAGVSVNGERNAVCVAVSPRGQGQKARKEGRDVLEQRLHAREGRKRGVEGDGVDVGNESRKRRAESVSICPAGYVYSMERLLTMAHMVLGTCGDAESETGHTLNRSPKGRANIEQSVLRREAGRGGKHIGEIRWHGSMQVTVLCRETVH